MGRIYLITAIDTDAGKSIATGVAALYLKSKGVNVITQKMAQTGCVDFSEDIATHRKIMGADAFPEDSKGLTCPYIFRFPASPKLAAALEGREIDINVIISATEELAKRYDTVIVEGVGGVMVPLAKGVTVLDYMSAAGYPVIIVANGKLGSVNHTLLSLEICKNRGINVAGMIYNSYIETEPVITKDTMETLEAELKRYYPEAGFAVLPYWEEGSPLPDLYGIFGV